MSKSVSSLAVVFAAFCIFTFSASTALASTSGVVISQIYGGGGNGSAKYTHDYVELFNAGSTVVDISNWSVQYASTAGTSWGGKSTFLPSTTLQPGQYYLVQESAGSSTSPGDLTPDASSGTFNMAAGHGNVALVSNATAISTTCAAGNADVVDFVGFGTAACYEGSATAAAASDNVGASVRNGSGCDDTDDNSADFTAADASPHNSSDATQLCASGNNIVVTMADVGHSEGNTGTTAYDFVVTLSKPAPTGGVTFDIATADGSATTADNDYTAVATTSASIAAGADTYTATVQVNGDTTVETNEIFTLTASNIQLGTADPTVNITSSVTANGTIYNDDATDAAIWDIQGSGAASLFVGQLVHTCGIVTAVGSSGFYVQSSTNNESDATCNTDGNPLTSDGVYVYSSTSVTPGDLIDFDAEVSEYNGLTELDHVSSLQTLSGANALPAAVVFDDITPSTDPAALTCGDTNFECLEGMRVTMANGMVTQASGYSSAHQYDYLYVTATGKRALREPGFLYGLNPATLDPNFTTTKDWDGNPEEFEMSPNEFANGYNGDTTPITGGSTFAATGIMTSAYNRYEFAPTALNITYAAPVPRAVPTADPAIMRIGEFNVERFCDNVDDTGTGGTEIYSCSNSLPTPAEYNTKAQRLADYIGGVLKFPDVVAVEEVENIGALQLLADKLASEPNGITYTPKLIEGNDVSGIDVGLLINTARVQVFSIQQLDKDLMWTTPNNHVRNVFDHPPLLLQGVFTGAGQTQPFMVMVNHLKARQNVDKVDSSGNSTAQAKEDQEKRFRQAYATAQLVQSLQTTYSTQTATAPHINDLGAFSASTHTSSASIPLAVVGDFNAYEFTDGFANTVGLISGRYDFDANVWDLTDLTTWNLQPIDPPLTNVNVVNPPLWDAVFSLPENERYSYLYAPNLGAIQGYAARKPPTDQALDHALLNTAARADFVRMDYGRADLDAANEDERNSTGAIGVSDHDGFVVQLTFDRIFADGFENKD